MGQFEASNKLLCDDGKVSTHGTAATDSPFGELHEGQIHFLLSGICDHPKRLAVLTAFVGL